MEYVTIFFAGLIVVQTVVFLIIFKRAVMRLDITRLEAVANKLSVMENRLGTTHVEELGKKPSNMTETTLPNSAMAALRLIGERGSVTSSDVTSSLQLSREHVARLLKSLHEMGLVSRDGKPFRYSLTDVARRLLEGGV